MLALLDRTALRVVLAVGFAASGLAAIASCGASAESASGYGNNVDGGGGGDGAANQDGGLFDSGLAPPPFVLAVHASPDLEDFRICFGISDSPTGVVVQDKVQPYPDNAYGPMPESNYPGIPVGGAVPLRTFTHGAFLVPYIIRASDLTRPGYDTLTCDKLICTTSTTCLHDGEFWSLPAIDRLRLMQGRRYVLAIGGCRSGASAGGCASAGPLDAQLQEVAASTGGLAGSLTGQFLHLAPAVGAISLSVDDAGVSLPAYGAIAPSLGVMTLPTPPHGDLAAYASESLHLTYADAGADFSLALVQRLSDPSMLPTAFFERDTPWVFVVLGDPAAASPLADGGINSAYDGRGLHIIALPTTPPNAGDGG
jgi:hypothetical protein